MLLYFEIKLNKIFEVDAHWDESVKLHACHLGAFDIPGRCFLISRQRQQLQIWVRMDGRGTQKQLAFVELATEDELERDEEDLGGREEGKGIEEGKKKQRFPFEEMLKVNPGLGVETSFKDDLSQYTT
jgi:hypothetical protein